MQGREREGGGAPAGSSGGVLEKAGGRVRRWFSASAARHSRTSSTSSNASHGSVELAPEFLTAAEDPDRARLSRVSRPATD